MMLKDVLQFQNQLDKALLAIDRVLPNETTKKVELKEFSAIDFAKGSKSLLQRCDDVCDSRTNVKPTLRIVHHFACTGGTLISKCLSAMPNVFLLSEVHPFTDLHLGKGKPKYLPSDISSLTKHANIPFQEKLAEKLFRDSIFSTYRHVEEFGGVLVLRDHSHSDFCVGEYNENTTSSVVDILSEIFEIKSLVTMRDPVDSYLSLDSNGWKHFSPFNFDEYCKRFCQFLGQFRGADVILYDDFTRQPKTTMRRMCDVLELSYDSCFEDIFDLFSVTGDSGRSGDVIKIRSKRTYKEEFLVEMKASRYFQELKLKIEVLSIHGRASVELL